MIFFLVIPEIRLKINNKQTNNKEHVYDPGHIYQITNKQHKLTSMMTIKIFILYQWITIK